MIIAQSPDSGTKLSRFTTDFEPPPDLTSIPDVVADYILELEAGGLYNEYEGARFSTLLARDLCAELGFNWMSVSPRFREMRALEINRYIKNPRLERSPSGILINRSLVDAMQDLRSLPQCPRPVTGWNTRNFARHHSWFGLCQKLACPTCAIDLVENILGHLERVTEALPSVFTSLIEYDEGLFSRMTTRRSGRDVEMLRLRRTDGLVAYVSSAPLGGRKPPQDWDEGTPATAIQWLKEVVLEVPFVRSRRWTDGWRPETDRGKDSEIRYLPLEEDQAEVVEDRLAIWVQERYGVGLCDVPDPEEARHEVEDMLVALADDVRTNWRG